MRLENPEDLDEFMKKASFFVSEIQRVLGDHLLLEQNSDAAISNLELFKQDVLQLAALAYSKSVVFSELLENYRQLLRVFADASPLMKGRRNIPIWIMYKDGDERTFAMTSPPSQYWMDLQRANGYVLIHLEVPVPDVADMRMGVVSEARVRVGDAVQVMLKAPAP